MAVTQAKFTSTAKPANDFAGSPGAQGASRLRDQILDISMKALAFVPANRAESLAKQLLPRGGLAEDDVADAIDRVAFALALAADLAIFVPSSSGATAIDRYLRQHGPKNKDETDAATAIRRARFRVIRIDARESAEVFRVTDLATGESLKLFDSKADPLNAGQVISARLSPIEGGSFVATGPVIPLDDGGIAVARSFFRPNGKGLSNAERCAEAIYRHVIRHGQIPASLTGALSEEDDEPDEYPFNPETNPIDTLAHRWARLATGVEPSAEGIAAARNLTNAEHLLEAVSSACIASDIGLPGLSEAYARIAVIQMETMQRRETIGSGAGVVSLDHLARLIDEATRLGHMPPTARALYGDLRRRVRTASSNPGGNPAGKQGGVDLDRLLQRIQGLRAKTVDHGCTEDEALAAAAKVAELLDRYGLSLSDVELRKQTCEGVGIETGRRRAGPIDQIVPRIAAFFDCRCWGEKTASDTIWHVIFGLPGDVEAAQYLYDLVEIAFETETHQFKNGELYGRVLSANRRSATTSFQLGLAHGIIVKLDKLRREREAALHRSSGRDLMVVKASIVEEELDKLGLAFTSKARKGKKQVLTVAYAAGQEAGERFDYRAGIGQGG